MGLGYANGGPKQYPAALFSLLFRANALSYNMVLRFVEKGTHTKVHSPSAAACIVCAIFVSLNPEPAVQMSPTRHRLRDEARTARHLYAKTKAAGSTFVRRTRGKDKFVVASRVNDDAAAARRRAFSDIIRLDKLLGVVCLREKWPRTGS